MIEIKDLGKRWYERIPMVGKALWLLRLNTALNNPRSSLDEIDDRIHSQQTALKTSKKRGRPRKVKSMDLDITTN